MGKLLDLLKEGTRLAEEYELAMNVCNKTDKVELSTLKPGETFKVGGHEFIVLEQRQGESFVITKGFMAEDVSFDNSDRDYNKSNLKKIIETDIQAIIEKAVGAETLVEHEVDLTSVDMQSEFNACKCKVRPLTFDEARQYNNLIVNKDLDGWYWTCTPWSTKERGWECSVAVVSHSGNVGYSFRSRNDSVGVRSVCILKSNIFVSKGE